MKPQTTLNRVVLPAPFGPMTPSTSFGSTRSETASSAVRPPKRTVTPVASNRPPVPVPAVPVLPTGTEPDAVGRGLGAVTRPSGRCAWCSSGVRGVGGVVRATGIQP
jgi:hypothetical protein